MIGQALSHLPFNWCLNITQDSFPSICYDFNLQPFLYHCGRKIISDLCWGFSPPGDDMFTIWMSSWRWDVIGYSKFGLHRRIGQIKHKYSKTANMATFKKTGNYITSEADLNDISITWILVKVSSKTHEKSAKKLMLLYIHMISTEPFFLHI